jgi:Protein of unknown function (DUF2917)
MNLMLHRAEIELDTRRFLTLDDAIGTRIVCVAGELWITQDRDTADHIVTAGGSFEVDAPGKVLVQAQRPARVVLIDGEAPANDGWFSRWVGVSRLDEAPPVVVATRGA